MFVISDVGVLAGSSACCGVKPWVGQRAASCCNSATLSSLFSWSSFRSSLTMSSSSIHVHAPTPIPRHHAVACFSSLRHAHESAVFLHGGCSLFLTGSIPKLWESPSISKRGHQGSDIYRAEVSTATLDPIRLDIRGTKSCHFVLFFLNWSLSFLFWVKALRRSTFHLKLWGTFGRGDDLGTIRKKELYFILLAFPLWAEVVQLLWLLLLFLCFIMTRVST